MAKQWKIGTVTVDRPDTPSGQWCATDSNYDGLADGNNQLGWGDSAWEAWLDLMEKLSERSLARY